MCRRRFRTGSARPGGSRLKQVIARENRLSLVMDRKERHFNIASAAEKYQLYDFLESWMRSLAAADLSAAINDLCKRYSVDLAALSREASMDWDDLATLAADPLVTIGSATVNYPVLSNLKDAAALREMTMGMAVARAALHRDDQAFRLSVRRSRLLAPAACRDGRRGGLCQRGVGDTGRDRSRRGEPICTRFRVSPGTDGCVRCAPCA